MIQPYSSIDMATACKNCCFILSEWSDFVMVDNLSISVYVLPLGMLTSLFVGIWTSLLFFKSLPFNVEMNSLLCEFAEGLILHFPSGLSVHQCLERPGFNFRLSHAENSNMVLDTSLINTQHYNLRIKGKVEQSKERSCTLPNTFVL